MRIHITTLGCRLNQSESDRLAREFVALGHEVVLDASTADLNVVNTCGVTHKATRESRQAARTGLRVTGGRHAPTVITGCASAIEPESFAQIDGVALVTGHAEKERLVPLLIERGILPPPDPFDSEAFPLPQSRTRAFVKIQDGCGNRCAYCVSRLARGHERSRPIRSIVREINLLVAEGFNEVVLTGLHAASYGRDFESSLAALVRTILAETSIPRLRLSSLEPWGASDDLLEQWDDPRLCRHLHLPLQSGSDQVLRRMRRGYNTRQFRARVEAGRRKIPGIGISTDIIVGFPGESEREFAESLRFVEEMQFAQAHVFPFSPRAGTEAAQMSGHIGPRTKRERCASIHEVTARSAEQFRRGLVGQHHRVLWEDQREGRWSGLTDNYVRVYASAADNLSNRITPAAIYDLCPGGVLGVAVSDDENLRGSADAET